MSKEKFKEEFKEYVLSSFEFLDSINYIMLSKKNDSIIFEIELYENEYLAEVLMGKELINGFIPLKLPPEVIRDIELKRKYNKYKRKILAKNELVFWKENSPEIIYL
jgi:hypothetical protein